MKKLVPAVLMAIAVPSFATAQTTATATVTAPTPAYSTTDTGFGTLWDNPASKAIIIRYFPELASPEAAAGLDQARAMTLRTLQQVKPDFFTDDKLNKVDADLAKLPRK